MSERVFRIILGLILLILLYFNQRALIYGYIAFLLLEGITNWRVPMLISRIRGLPVKSNSERFSSMKSLAQINFEAERALRLVVFVFLVLSYAVFNKELWFFPWFIGFALFGAGLSGICPMVLSLRWIGFR